MTTQNHPNGSSTPKTSPPDEIGRLMTRGGKYMRQYSPASGIGFVNAGVDWCHKNGLLLIASNIDFGIHNIGSGQWSGEFVYQYDVRTRSGTLWTGAFQHRIVIPVTRNRKPSLLAQGLALRAGLHTLFMIPMPDTPDDLDCAALDATKIDMTSVVMNPADSTARFKILEASLAELEKLMDLSAWKRRKKPAIDMLWKQEKDAIWQIVRDKEVSMRKVAETLSRQPLLPEATRRMDRAAQDVVRGLEHSKHHNG